VGGFCLTYEQAAKQPEYEVQQEDEVLRAGADVGVVVAVAVVHHGGHFWNFLYFFLFLCF
jgi:hypothetical protein